MGGTTGGSLRRRRLVLGEEVGKTRAKRRTEVGRLRRPWESRTTGPGGRAGGRFPGGDGGPRAVPLPGQSSVIHETIPPTPTRAATAAQPLTSPSTMPSQARTRYRAAATMSNGAAIASRSAAARTDGRLTPRSGLDRGGLATGGGGLLGAVEPGRVREPWTARQPCTMKGLRGSRKAMTDDPKREIDDERRLSIREEQPVSVNRHPAQRHDADRVRESLTRQATATADRTTRIEAQ